MKSLPSQQPDSGGEGERRRRFSGCIVAIVLAIGLLSLILAVRHGRKRSESAAAAASPHASLSFPVAAASASASPVVHSTPRVSVPRIDGNQLPQMRAAVTLRPGDEPRLPVVQMGASSPSPAKSALLAPQFRLGTAAVMPPLPPLTPSASPAAPPVAQAETTPITEKLAQAPPQSVAPLLVAAAQDLPSAAVATPGPSVPPAGPALSDAAPEKYAILSAAEARSEREAIARYSTLPQSDTLMNMLYRAHADDLRQRADPLLKSPDWPERLADQCASESQAYLKPGLLSQTGEVSLLPDESFNNYHVRRDVMKRFNALVALSHERNAARYPDSVDANAWLNRKRGEKAAWLRENQPAFFENPNWPEQLTDLCLTEKK